MTSAHERYEALLVKATDGLLTDDERSELDVHLESCRECAEELADFHVIKETTDAMTSRILAHATIEPPRLRGAPRAWVIVCWLLMLTGMLLFIGRSGYELVRDETVPLTIKVGIGLLAGGALGLLAYVLRVRARAVGRDPYVEIDR